MTPTKIETALAAIRVEAEKLQGRLAQLDSDREALERAAAILNGRTSPPATSEEPKAPATTEHEHRFLNGVCRRYDCDAKKPGVEAKKRGGQTTASRMGEPLTSSPQPSARRSAHMGRHTFRNGSCTKDGCDAKGEKGDTAATQRASGRGSTGSSEPAKQERASDPALVAKLAGDDEPGPAPPAADGPGKVYHAKQVTSASDPCPKCKQYPVNSTNQGVQGRCLWCPGPLCGWREWTIPGVASAT